MPEIFAPPLIQAQSWKEAQPKFNQAIQQLARMLNSIYTGANIPTGRIKDGAITAVKLTITDLVNIANLLTVADGKIIIGEDAIGAGLHGILINDGTYDRVLIGEVAADTYGITIKDAAGNTMISQGSFTFGDAKARAYGATSIVIQPFGGNGGNTIVLLDTESYDPGSNFNNSTWFSGTTTATTANKLEDSGASFSGLVGYTVKNTTDTTYAQIKAVDSGTVLSLSTDIFTNGEGYEIKHSKFVAPVAGEYLCMGEVALLIDDPALIDESFTVRLLRNGSPYTGIASETGSKAGTRSIYIPISDIIPLAVGDRVELYVAVVPNQACTLSPNASRDTFLVCHLFSAT